MKYLFSTCIVVFLSLTCFSQSLLWKVSGKDLASPSYLYGTIHIQDKRVFQYDSTVVKAFQSCEAFAGELLLDQVDVKAVRASMMMPKGKVLSELLSKDDYRLLDSICKETVGVSVLFMNTTKPFFVMSTIQQMQMPKDESQPLDMYLLKEARQQGKSCYGLEDYLEQIKAIDAIKLKDQVQMMMENLRDTLGYEAQYDTMLQAYLQFNLDKMSEIVEDPRNPANFENALVSKRNVTMAKGFVKIAKAETLFCAVGAAHLAGDKGVIALLRKKGYTVEPVVFQWEE